MRKSHTRKPAEPPDAAQLRGAALTYLARFAATESSLTRVLLRKIDRWQAQAAAEAGSEAGAEMEAESAAQRAQLARETIAGIVKQLAAEGAVSDAQFAEARARALIRAGRSRRAVGAHLAARGVASALAAAVLPEDATHEMAAVLIHARKRRLGPWRQGSDLPENVRRELGSLARAGFPHSVAAKALRLDREEAEALISLFRSAL
jgi:regulatory protein